MLDLIQLERKLDEVLKGETAKSLILWLAGKRELKVYGIWEGAKYEGGATSEDLYLDKEKARLFLLQRVSQENEKTTGLGEYKEVAPDKWKLGSDCIELIEFTIHN